jgi:hypothetical protein
MQELQLNGTEAVADGTRQAADAIYIAATATREQNYGGSSGSRSVVTKQRCDDTNHFVVCM